MMGGGGGGREGTDKCTSSHHFFLTCRLFLSDEEFFFKEAFIPSAMALLILTRVQIAKDETEEVSKWPAPRIVARWTLVP